MSIGVRCLLDVNVFVALVIRKHPFHQRVHNWFQRTPDRSWATCPLTQGGFLRVATFVLGGSRDAMRSAISSLEEGCSGPNHEFWPVDVDLRETIHGIGKRLIGPNQVTDLQLLLLAHKHHGQLATLDTGIRELAAGTRYADSLLLL